MPNWCSNNVRIICPKPEDVALLAKKLDAADKLPGEDGKTNPGWIGNLMKFIGKEPDLGNCRGWISYIQEEPDANMLVIDMESAWAPKVWPIKRFAEYFVPDAVVLYTAVEPGCELYMTNDESFMGSYFVDAWDDGVDGLTPEQKKALEPGSNCLTEAELREYLIGITNKPELPTDALIAEAENVVTEWSPKGGVGLSVHPFEWDEIEEY